VPALSYNIHCRNAKKKKSLLLHPGKTFNRKTKVKTGTYYRCDKKECGEEIE
jgi:hypothetical protein